MSSGPGSWFFFSSCYFQSCVVDKLGHVIKFNVRSYDCETSYREYGSSYIQDTKITSHSQPNMHDIAANQSLDDTMYPPQSS